MSTKKQTTRRMMTFPRLPDGLLQAVGLPNAGRYKSL